MSKFIKKTSPVFKALKGIDFWFAGGCLRDFLNGEEPKDYDLYFKSEADSRNALERVEHDFIIRGDHVSMVTFEGMKLSFIHSRNFQTADEIINGFDFHCVSACIDHRGKYTAHPWFEDLARQKKLTINNITTPFSTFERVGRFLARGYKIETKELYEVAKAIQACDELYLDYYAFAKGSIK